MIPEFDKNAAYIWAIVAFGLATPVLIGLYAILRARYAAARLKQVENDTEPT